MKKFTILFLILLIYLTSFMQKSFAASPVFIGAGDICGDTIDYSYLLKSGISIENAMATANLILAEPSATVFTAGDNVQVHGLASEFTNCFNPTWGQFKNRIHPTVGNHEYGEFGSGVLTPGAVPYFNYFGQAAGTAGQGWYSYDLPNNWHIIVLNSECYIKDKGANICDITSQEKWLMTDLASNANKHLIAIWHHPRFSSSATTANTKTDPAYKVFWDDLYNAKADIIINGHYHVYERFAKQNPDGNKVSNGIREFIVGTGGYDHHNKFTSALLPNSEASNDTSFGVLKLTLNANSYDWQFIPVVGQTFTDSGTSITNLNFTPTPVCTPKTGTCTATPNYCDGRGTAIQTCGLTTKTVPCTVTPAPNKCDTNYTCQSKVCKLNPTSTPTPTPIPTSTPTPTPIPNHIVLTFIIGLDGIGHTGTNTNADWTPKLIPATFDKFGNQTSPGSASGSNQNPLTKDRPLKVEIINASGHYVATPSVSLSYDDSSASASLGKFIATVDLGSSFKTGSYTVKTTVNGYLTRTIPGIQTIRAGQEQAVSARLVTGDINNDNALTIFDYNILISCIHDSSINNPDNGALCAQNANYATRSDLDDNGVINSYDYNLYLDELSVQSGD